MPLRTTDWFSCFGCAPNNPRGLRLSPRRTAADQAECDAVFDPDLCSYPGIVHGGIVGTAADDLMANLLLMERGVLAFSTLLRTRFLRPVLVGRRYRILARITGTWPDGFGTEADVSTEDGELCAVATGAYAPVRAEHVQSLLAVDVVEHKRLTAYLAAAENKGVR